MVTSLKDDVVDGGNKHTCGRAGKLVQLKKVDHS